MTSFLACVSANLLKRTWKKINTKRLNLLPLESFDDNILNKENYNLNYINIKNGFIQKPCRELRERKVKTENIKKWPYSDTTRKNGIKERWRYSIFI